MAKTVHSTTPTIMTGDFLTPTSPNLLADKRSHSSGQSSPARVSSTGKTTPSTERRPQMNGHPSPLHLPTSNTTNNNADVEGYMKTDDRMRLAKERREERERSLAAREQLIKEKERRARLQYERTVEERWRRLEEQRQKEELRRAAVEEKRRQQLEEEKERLDALMKRSLERSLQLEQRNKRWSRGYAAGDSENITPPPLSAASAFPHGIASSLPASSESAPCSPHRSPYRGTLSPADASRAGLQGGSQSTPNTPKKERLLRRARRTASPAYVSPVRRAESPASVSKQLTCPTASRLTSKMRAQSPCAARQHHSSPVRRQSHPSADGDGKEKTKRASGPPQEEAQTDPERVTKKADVVSQEPSSQAEKNGANLGTSKVTPAEPSDKGKAGAGSTNAEEASRLLAERRRQAREQKEIDEIRQTREKEERLKTQQLEKQPSQERLRQEGEGNRKEKEGEEKRQKEEQKGLNSQMEREKQKSKEQEEEEEEEEAERQRLDREQQKRQEEEERQLRKKRIEEIMKRTRKGEADLKEGQLEALAVSTPGELKMNVQTSDIANEQAIQKVTFQVKEQVEKSEDSLKREVSEEATTRVDHKKSMQVKTDTHQDGATKGMNTNPVSARQDAQVSKNGVGHLVKQQEGQVEAGVKKDGAQESGLATVRVNKEPPKKKADAKEKKQEEGVIMNGQVKNPGSVPVKSQSNAEVRKQNGLKVEVRAVTSAPETKANIKLEKEAGNPGTRLSVDPPATPIIRLEPLDVGRPGSGDEVQPMEVSPASKEELISIPEFSPIKETQLNSLSNSCALDELLDLTGTMGYSKLSPVANRGDCNLNLIQGVVNPVADPEAIHTSTASSNTLSIQ